MIVEAALYQKMDNERTRCLNCAHYCLLKKDAIGRCGTRHNENGQIMCDNYALTTGLFIDPIEKKPLRRFLSGTSILSFGSFGCNLCCAHCQNYAISQMKNEEDRQRFRLEEIQPEAIILAAKTNHCPAIAYTYNEPTVFLEYALATMKLARRADLKNVWVSNGFMSPRALELIIPYLDAINVDLKAMSEKFYHEICGARLAPVLNNLLAIKKAKIHLEVTTLIIPGKNDGRQELKRIARFIKDQLGDETPWHVSAFYPAYKLNHLPPTDPEKIIAARDIGLTAGLRYVYSGNI